MSFDITGNSQRNSQDDNDIGSAPKTKLNHVKSEVSVQNMVDSATGHSGIEAKAAAHLSLSAKATNETQLSSDQVHSMVDEVKHSLHEETETPVQTEVESAPQELSLEQHLYSAIEAGDHDSAKAALEHGANPNTVFAVPQEDGSVRNVTLIEHSLGNVKMTHLLVQNGAKPTSEEFESLFWFGNSEISTVDMLKLCVDKGTVPTSSNLNSALRSKNLEVINFLLDKGVKVTRNEMKTAVESEDSVVVDFLLEKGVKFDFEMTSHARNCNNFAAAKSLAAADPFKADYGHNATMVVHRFGISRLGLEGYDTFATTKELTQSAARYFSEKPKTASIDHDKIVSSIQNSSHSYHALESLDKGEIVSVATAWLPVDYKELKASHAVSLVFFKSPEGDYFCIKGNRGFMRDQMAMGIFKVENPENIDEAIKKIRANEEAITKSDSQKVEGETYFTTTINTELGLQPYPNKDNGVLHKGQTTGNCAWASIKLIMEAAAYASLIQKGFTHEIALAESAKLYKDFTAFDRNMSLSDLADFIDRTPPELLTDKNLRDAGLPTLRALIGELAREANIPRDLPGLEKIAPYFDKNTTLADLLLRNKSFESASVSFETAIQLLKYVEANPTLKSDPKLQDVLSKFIVKSAKTYDIWKTTPYNIQSQFIKQVSSFAESLDSVSSIRSAISDLQLNNLFKIIGNLKVPDGLELLGNQINTNKLSQADFKKIERAFIDRMDEISVTPEKSVEIIAFMVNRPEIFTSKISWKIDLILQKLGGEDQKKFIDLLIKHPISSKLNYTFDMMGESNFSDVTARLAFIRPS